MLFRSISTTTMSCLAKDENVSTEILAKICTALNCDVGDIMESVPESKIEEEVQYNVPDLFINEGEE